MAKAAPRPEGKKTRKIPVPVLCLLVLLVLLLAAFLVFYIRMKGQTRPDRVADRYVSTFMSRDANALFDLIGFSTSPFITRDAFARSMEECHSYSTIASYSIVQYPAESEDQRSFGIQYWDDHNNSPYSQTLVLNRSQDRLYLLFDNWTVDATEYLAKNCSLAIPAGASATLDGVALTDDMQAETTDTSAVYTAGDLFIGNHTIQVSMEGFEDFSAQVYLGSGDYADKDIYTITTSMMTITDETEKYLKQQAKSFIRALYDTALSEKSFSDLADAFVFEDTTRSSMEQAYDTLVANNISSAAHLTGVDFADFSSTTSSAYAEDHCYAVTVTSEIEYTAQSEVPQSSADGAEPGSSPRSTSGRSLFTTTFHFKNGTWSIYSSTAFDTCIYYTRY